MALEDGLAGFFVDGVGEEGAGLDFAFGVEEGRAVAVEEGRDGLDADEFLDDDILDAGVGVQLHGVHEADGGEGDGLLHGAGG